MIWNLTYYICFFIKFFYVIWDLILKSYEQSVDANDFSLSNFFRNFIYLKYFN